jgi:arginine decarboxylase
MLEATPATPLIDAMLAYAKQGRIRFHVPGHVGRAFWPEGLRHSLEALGINERLLQHDLTELEGLDTLSIPEGVLAESQALLAQRYNVAHSFYLINGSSVGIHAAMLAGFQPGDTVIVPRNAHRSVMAGMVLGDITPHWCMPEWEAEWGIWGAVTLQTLQQAYASAPHAKGVILTSPTYEGIISPIEPIAQWCREHQLTLIVDEAHGAHLHHTPGCPHSATQFMGVDAVVQSPHKTIGALTQGAWLHLPKASRLSPHALQQALNTLQSTSPSYPLLASLEATSAWLASEAGQAQRQRLWRNVKPLRERIHGMTAFRLLESPKGEGAKLDGLRLYLRHAYHSGDTWTDILEHEQGLSYELNTPLGGAYIAQAGHQPADFVAFMNGLHAYAKEYPLHKAEGAACFSPEPKPMLPAPQVATSPRLAFFATKEHLPLEKAVGRIAGETVVRCPPGVPVVLAGETIQAEHLPYLDVETIAVLEYAYLK